MSQEQVENKMATVPLDKETTSLKLSAAMELLMSVMHNAETPTGIFNEETCQGDMAADLVYDAADGAVSALLMLDIPEYIPGWETYFNEEFPLADLDVDVNVEGMSVVVGYELPDREGS